MQFVRQIAIMLERFGQPVFVTCGKKRQGVKAFIQPVQYTSKMYLEPAVSSLGSVDEGLFVYIGPPEPAIDTLGRDVLVEAAGGKYDVTRAQAISFGSERLYCWAVLKPRYENGEAER